MDVLKEAGEQKGRRAEEQKSRGEVGLIPLSGSPEFS